MILMKNWRNFGLYATGRLVSLIGTGIQDLAVPLFILDLTGSGTTMGTFMIITMAPRLILYPLAGVVGDRINRKWIMVSMDFGRGAVILFLAHLAARNIVTIPVLFAAQFVISLMNALFGPATLAMLPDLVEEEDLTRANSTIQGITSVSSIVGPALGGILYGVGGIQIAFLLNGISFILSGISEFFIQYYQITKKIEKVHEVITDLKEGFSFIKTHKGVLTLLVFALVLNFLMAPFVFVLIPFVLRTVIGFSSEQYGLLQTSFVTGILIGNIVIGTLLAKKKIKPMLCNGLLLQIGFTFVFVGLIFPQVLSRIGYASWTLFSLLFGTFMAIGIFNAFANTPLMVEIQKLTPAQFMARVFSVMETTTMGVVPIGFGIMGILLDVVPAYLIASVVVVADLVVALLFVGKYSQIVFKDFEGNNS
jgi:MFS family permease